MNQPAVRLSPEELEEAQRILAHRIRARRHLLDFITYTKPDYDPAWFHREICGLLDAFVQDVEAKRSPNVMLFLPPGSGKSEIISRRFPAFVFGLHPEWHWINASYNSEFAAQFGKDVRQIMEDQSYADLFPNFKVREDSGAIGDWITTRGGKYFATGVGGGSTGRRAHILVVDDPIKDMQDADSPAKQKECWDWYSAVANTRGFPGFGKLFVQTPWSLEDTSQRLLEIARTNPGTEQWVVYKYPSIAEVDERHRKAGQVLHPERYTLDEMIRRRDTLFASGQARVWHALYQCNPTPTEGTAFKRDWILPHLYQPATRPENLVTYITTDFAVETTAKNDWSVVTSWGVASDGHIYMLSCDRFRGTPNEIVARVCNAVKQWRPAKLIMEKVHQTSTLGPFLEKRLRELNLFTVIDTVTPSKKKEARAASIRGRMQQGMVHLPDSPQSHDVIIPELLSFPGGRNDDVCDTFSLLGLVLDETFEPGAPAAAPAPTGPQPGSMAWVRDQSARKRQEDARPGHVPSRLDGRPRGKVAPFRR